MLPDPRAVKAEREARDRLFHAIGEFVFEFSQLEFTIRHVLGCALGIKEDEKFDAITASYDSSTHCRVTSRLHRTADGSTDEDRAELKHIFDECQRLNDEARVPIAHGTWFIGDDSGGGGTRHMSRNSLTVRVLYDKVEDIIRASRQVSTVRSRIVEFLIGPRSSWPDFSDQTDHEPSPE